MSQKNINYFLTFRLQNPDLVRNLRKVHLHFVTKNESMKNYIDPLDTAHITLNVFHADNNQVDNLKQLIQKELDKYRDSLNPPDQFEVQGLGMFGQTVLWAAPTGGQDFLHKIHDIFQNLLMEHNFYTKTHSYNPHVTLFQSRGTKMNIEKEDLGRVDRFWFWLIL